MKLFCFPLKNCLHQRRNKGKPPSFSLFFINISRQMEIFHTEAGDSVTESMLTVSRVERSDEGLECRLLRAHEISN